MSKQTAAPSSAVQTEAPPDVNSQELKRERDRLKEKQKTRFAGLDRGLLIELYRQMILIRRFEEKSAEVYVAGKIGGFCHLYIGQEACGVGTICRDSQRRLRPCQLSRTWSRARERHDCAMRSWQSFSAKPPDAQKAKAARCTCLTRASVFLADTR